ncbi:MAG TPA: class I SAM-dependent methyltransferase, partial [Reyranella sp.]|nr:class I SAM-dependent methyltransferase [Reyranella sp.]
MANTDTVFAGSIPALYDRYLGPLLFEPYARETAARLADLKAGTLLETAAGTGLVTSALAARLPASVKIIATDLNQAMLDFAAAKPDLARVELRQADALALPFGDASFDAVVCQFGAMFFPDRVRGYREAYRVLRP